MRVAIHEGIGGIPKEHGNEERGTASPLGRTKRWDPRGSSDGPSGGDAHGSLGLRRSTGDKRGGSDTIGDALKESPVSAGERAQGTGAGWSGTSNDNKTPYFYPFSLGLI